MKFFIHTGSPTPDLFFCSPPSPPAPPPPPQDEQSALVMVKKHQTLEQALEDYAQTIHQLANSSRLMVTSEHPERSEVNPFLPPPPPYRSSSRDYQLLI